jgi:hypothetical protein
MSSHGLLRAALATDGLRLPKSVASVPLPDSALAKAAAALAYADCPGFLFNHCVRTYLFGCLLAPLTTGRPARGRNAFDHEQVFIASALHDLGLLPKYASPSEPFEIDSAEAAKAFLDRHGVPARTIGVIWDAIAMHASPIGEHKSLEVQLVGRGAGADVFGGGIGRLSKADVATVLAAFPRDQFNSRFRELLFDHCRRKPLSTTSTWLDAFCRSHLPTARFPTIDGGFARSPFKE